MQTITHRGCGVLAQDNTLDAVVKATHISSLYGCEIDVHCTADNVVVLHHDDTIGEVLITNLTYHQILTYKPYVPTLEAVLIAITSVEKFKLLVELKTKGATHEYTKRLVSQVIRLIKQFQLVDRCILLSFEEQTLRCAHQVCSVIALCYNDELCSPASVPDICFYWAPCHTHLTKEHVDLIHAKNKHVLVWTVNDINDINRVKTLGVDGIVTDQPCLCQ